MIVEALVVIDAILTNFACIDGAVVEMQIHKIFENNLMSLAKGVR